MGKVKSAVITAVLVAAIAVLAFFAFFSWQVPGSNGVSRYNSFISGIRLGGDLTGEASAVLYPDGVITAADYNFGMPEVPEGDEAADLTEEELAELKDKQKEYISRYVKRGDLYIDNDAITEYGEDGFKAHIQKDAEVLSGRLGEKGYSAYSVAVRDNYTIQVTVPTDFTYAAYKQYDTSARSDATTAISRTIQFLSYNGELSLRNGDVGKKQHNNILTPISADITTYFKNVTKYAVAGNYAVKVNLTQSGREQFRKISGTVADNSGEDKAIGFFIGDNQLLSLTVSSVIDENSFFITVDKAYAQDYAIILNSVVHGETLALDYNSDSVDIVYGSAALGGNAAIYFGAALLLIVAASVILSVLKYKRLGLVNAIMIAIYALTIITALLLIEIQFTIAGALAAVLGLALLCGSNFAVFEAVRRETKKGKTMPSSIKSGYKSMLTGVLDLHIILTVVSLMLALICVGELAACGLIFFIATVASYVLHWFTRFMWYVISSPVRNKFAFGGFTREEQIDD